MKKNMKVIIGITLGIIIGTSTIVGAATIFRSEDITYSSSATSKTNVKDSLDELYNLTSNYEFYKPLASLVELGDYISITPTKTSYLMPKYLTGCSNDQTINPSELNLWRVIKKNEDGTVEVVSEYISSMGVCFSGTLGFYNFIGGLNILAAQYINAKYVVATRHMGYSNQIEHCSNTSVSACPYDTDHVTDVNLVKKALGGTLSATSKDGGRGVYWLASRPTALETGYEFTARLIKANGELEYHYLLDSDGNIPNFSEKIRPILTLKANVEIKSGDGKSAKTAYIFE